MNAFLQLNTIVELISLAKRLTVESVWEIISILKVAMIKLQTELLNNVHEVDSNSIGNNGEPKSHNNLTLVYLFLIENEFPSPYDRKTNATASFYQHSQPFIGKLCPGTNGKSL